MVSNAFNRIFDNNVAQLYSAAASIQDDGNFAISPLSIFFATALMYVGSSGTTKSNLEKSLRFDQNYKSNADSILSDFSTCMANLTSSVGDRDGDPFTISMANGILLNKGVPLVNKFKHNAISKLRSKARRLDFKGDPRAARQEINTWVSGKTSGQIKDLLPQDAVSSDTVAVLANAFYFKGSWDDYLKFDPSDTSKNDFVMLNGRKKQVDMMNSFLILPYAEDDNLDIQYMEYSYTYNQGSMVFLLPRRKDGLRTLEKKLTGAVFDALHKTAQDNHKKVAVTLPKFRIDSDFDLIGLMTKIGIKDAFEKSKANFSKMTPRNGVFVSSGRHKTYFAIDEKGTEAAVSASTFGGGGSIEFEPPKNFKADHPFIFAVRHASTNVILFVGRVEKF